MNAYRVELVELVKKRNAVETRINQISHAMEAMADTCEDAEQKAAYRDEIRSITERVGFQSAIRSALIILPPGRGMTAIEIRDWIEKRGQMDLSAYNNPLASIYTTIRRMKENGEVEDCDKSGEKAFRLIRSYSRKISPPPGVKEKK